MTVVVDTGVLLAAADHDDADHAACASLLREHRGQLVVPGPVVPETAWQIERNLSYAPTKGTSGSTCCPGSSG